MKYQTLTDHLLADPLLFARAVMGDEKTTPNSLSFVSFLKTIKELGYTEEDLEKACDTILGSSLGTVALPDSFPRQEPDAPVPSKTIAIKAPPGLYRITRMGDVVDSASTPLGHFLVTVGQKGWDTRLVLCQNEWCEAKLIFDDKDIQWRLAWTTSAGHEYDLAFNDEQSEAYTTKMVFQGTLKAPQRDEGNDEALPATTELHGVLESPRTTLATLLGTSASSLLDNYPEKPATSGSGNSGNISMMTIMPVMAIASNTSGRSNGSNGGGQPNNPNGPGGGSNQGPITFAGVIVTIAALVFIVLLIAGWRRRRQIRQALRDTGRRMREFIAGLRAAPEDDEATPPSENSTRPSFRQVGLQVNPAQVGAGLTNADVIRYWLDDSYEQEPPEEREEMEMVFTEQNQRITSTYPQTGAIFDISQPRQINPRPRQIHLVDNEFDVVVGSRPLGTISRRPRRLRRWLVVNTLCNQATNIFRHRRGPGDGDGNAGGEHPPEGSRDVAGQNPGSQTGEHGGNGNNTNTNAIEVPLSNDMLHASQWSQVCYVLDLQNAAVDFFADKLARSAQDTISGSFTKMDPIDGVAIPPKTTAIEWGPMVTWTLTKMESELSEIPESVGDMQEMFLSRIQNSLADKLQGSLALQYVKLAKEHTGSTLLKVFGTPRFAGNVINNAIFTATQSEAVIDGIATETRRIAYASALGSSGGVLNPKTPAETFQLQQSIEDKAEQYQTQFLSYVEGLTKLAESGEINNEESAKAVAASVGLSRTGPDTFAPVKMPEAQPGVPFWLLGMCGKGMKTEAAAPVAPSVGGNPAPSSDYFSKLSGGVLIGGSGIEPGAPVIPSRNPSIVIPSRASSIVSEGPKVQFYLINGGQELQVGSNLASGGRRNR